MYSNSRKPCAMGVEENLGCDCAGDNPDTTALSAVEGGFSTVEAGKIEFSAGEGDAGGSLHSNVLVQSAGHKDMDVLSWVVSRLFGRCFRRDCIRALYIDVVGFISHWDCIVTKRFEIARSTFGSTMLEVAGVAGVVEDESACE